MESIYYVMTYLCHRNCPHCYEDRFHPYYGDDLTRVAAESRAHFAAILEHFPDTMLYRASSSSEGELRRGRVILAGGEILLEAVRESVLYPALAILWRKYGRDVRIVVQTTGDLLTDAIVQELVERHVETISVSGLDSYHAGLEKEAAREALMHKLRAMFERHGVIAAPSDLALMQQGQAYFHFFGATPGSWIGKLWPRGRAWANGLSSAGLTDNFCNGWSGGLRFLEYGSEGSEVSVDPEGKVFPCCPKTKRAIGNLREEKLESMLARLRGNPVYEAINAGAPQQMGVAHGWSEEYFLQRSRTVDANGRPYANLCLGCDAFHDEVLASPALGLVQIQQPVTDTSSSR